VFRWLAANNLEPIKYPEPGRNSGLLGLWMLAVTAAGIVWCVSAGVTLLILRFKSPAVRRATSA
jgi:hypothetical protein